MLKGIQKVCLYTDGEEMLPVRKEEKMKKEATIRITIQPQGGFIITK